MGSKIMFAVQISTCHKLSIFDVTVEASKLATGLDTVIEAHFVKQLLQISLSPTLTLIPFLRTLENFTKSKFPHFLRLTTKEFQIYPSSPY